MIIQWKHVIPVVSEFFIAVVSVFSDSRSHLQHINKNLLGLKVDKVY
jgi:hypothetical protein